jgi:hypothetical protein
MILVKKNADESSQKVISTFLKRVKKSNLVARKRKTRYHSKGISKLEQKKKAIRTAKWLEKQKILSRTAK